MLYEIASSLNSPCRAVSFRLANPVSLKELKQVSDFRETRQRLADHWLERFNHILIAGCKFWCFDQVVSITQPGSQWMQRYGAVSFSLPAAPYSVWVLEKYRQ